MRPLYDGQSFCYKHYETSLSNKSNLVLWEKILNSGTKNIGNADKSLKIDIILLLDNHEINLNVYVLYSHIHT